MPFDCPIHGPYTPVGSGTLALCPACSAPKHAAMQGWECPRCHVIHSPFTQRCYCRPPTITTAGQSHA